MSVRRLPVRATANFQRSLERIEAFLDSAQASTEFDAVVQRLVDDIVPTLGRYPELGADFLGRAPLSTDGRVLFAKVASLLGPASSLRQLVTGDYILLYAVRKEAVYLLAIRHHRELSFDFMGHWP
jgi:hypothetical protein